MRTKTDRLLNFKETEMHTKIAHCTVVKNSKQSKKYKTVKRYSDGAMKQSIILFIILFDTECVLIITQ